MKRKFVTLMLVPLMLAGCRNATSGSAAQASGEPTDTIKPVVIFSGDSAYRSIERQLEFGPRIPGSQGQADCRDYIVNSLKRYGADSIIIQSAKVENFLGQTIPIYNIMGRYNVGANKRILLLTHWDTRPWADSDPEMINRDKPVPGANDGASGVGILIELARLLQQKEPSVGVDLLFVDAEDSGSTGGWNRNDETWCLGTQYWIEHMPYPADELPEYAILLDMVGGTDAKFFREYVAEQNAADINTKVWSVAEASGYGDRFINNVRGGIIDDHVFINRAGIPAIDIIECGNEATGTFPSNWHTIHDDITGIDKATLKAVGQTVANTIYLERK